MLVAAAGFKVHALQIVSPHPHAVAFEEEGAEGGEDAAASTGDGANNDAGRIPGLPAEGFDLS